MNYPIEKTNQITDSRRQIMETYGQDEVDEDLSQLDCGPQYCQRNPQFVQNPSLSLEKVQVMQQRPSALYQDNFQNQKRIRARQTIKSIDFNSRDARHEQQSSFREFDSVRTNDMENSQRHNFNQGQLNFKDNKNSIQLNNNDKKLSQDIAEFIGKYKRQLRPLSKDKKLKKRSFDLNTFEESDQFKRQIFNKVQEHFIRDNNNQNVNDLINNFRGNPSISNSIYMSNNKSMISRNIQYSKVINSNKNSYTNYRSQNTQQAKTEFNKVRTPSQYQHQLVSVNRQDHLKNYNYGIVKGNSLMIRKDQFHNLSLSTEGKLKVLNKQSAMKIGSRVGGGSKNPMTQSFYPQQPPVRLQSSQECQVDHPPIQYSLHIDQSTGGSLNNIEVKFCSNGKRSGNSPKANAIYSLFTNQKLCIEENNIQSALQTKRDQNTSPPSRADEQIRIDQSVVEETALRFTTSPYNYQDGTSVNNIESPLKPKLDHFDISNSLQISPTAPKEA